MPTRPLTRAITQSLTRKPTDPAVGGGFDPASLFAGSEVGLAYDFATAGNNYQDNARTTLVAANNDPIASPTDLSGKGNHGLVAADANRPIFQSGADFDGTNHYLLTPVMDFSTTLEMTIVMCMRRDVSGIMCLAMSNDARGFQIFGDDGTDNYEFILNNGGTGRATGNPAGGFDTISVVFDLNGSGVTGQMFVRVNGVAQSLTTHVAGTGLYSFFNSNVKIGQFDDVYRVNGRYVRLLMINRRLTAGEILDAEAWASSPLA